MFHVELRQFPNVARAFNLSREELDARILAPWIAERPVELDERRFSPEKARLTIYEGPQLAPEEMGLGRSWGNATRGGQDVTSRIVEEARGSQGPDHPAAMEPLKLELLQRASDRSVTCCEALAVAGEQLPGRRVSHQLALAEQAVWELLHRHRVRMVRDGVELEPEQWEAVLLARETWVGGDGEATALEALPVP